MSCEAAGVVAQLARAVPEIRETRKVFGLELALVGSLLGAASGTLYVLRRGTGQLYKVKSFAAGGGTADRSLAQGDPAQASGTEPWDMALVTKFFRNEKPHLEAGVVMAPVRVGTEVVGVLALARRDGFASGAGKTATEILRIVGGLLADRRRAAVLEAEASVGRAIARGVARRDVIYRILHQLRRFLDYDHGATVVECLDHATGRVAARQVAWRQGKSDVVGRTFGLPWDEFQSQGAASVEHGSLAGVRDALSGIAEAGAPSKGSMIVIRIAVDSRVLGCLEIASQRPGFFGDRDLAIATQFLTYLSWCLSEEAV